MLQELRINGSMGRQKPLQRPSTGLQHTPDMGRFDDPPTDADYTPAREVLHGPVHDLSTEERSAASNSQIAASSQPHPQPAPNLEHEELSQEAQQFLHEITSTDHRHWRHHNRNQGMRVPSEGQLPPFAAAAELRTLGWRVQQSIEHGRCSSGS